MYPGVSTINPNPLSLFMPPTVLLPRVAPTKEEIILIGINRSNEKATVFSRPAAS